ncbi:hypothetical protein EMPS_04355 [Entomortierella parvispora]|uniref:Stress-associated endoplasmic reticulum protein n=1 Tax=Entomortierella parvispora TaxID=205924 RepID=A0A9P3H8X9_9FUNG|nr:hypothetical protein EMPS_04355 [Entomortierella parvispora]
MATASSPVMRARNAKYQANVTKRGHTKGASDKSHSSSSSTTKSKSSAVSPALAGFLVVLLCGGAIVEILRLFGAGAQTDGF